MLEVPTVKNTEVEPLLQDSDIPYLGILTFDDELWLIDRRVVNSDTNLISRGRMAFIYKAEELEGILAQLSDEKVENPNRRRLVLKIRDCLISKGRVCRLMS